MVDGVDHTRYLTDDGLPDITGGGVARRRKEPSDGAVDMVILDDIDGGTATEDERFAPVQHWHELVGLGHTASGWSRDSSGLVVERVAGSSRRVIVCHCLVSEVQRYQVTQNHLNQPADSTGHVHY